MREVCWVSVCGVDPVLHLAGKHSVEAHGRDECNVQLFVWSRIDYPGHC